jgi:hypothetical protein
VVDDERGSRRRQTDPVHEEPGDYLRAVWADARPRPRGVPLQPVLTSPGQPPKFRVLDEVVPAGEAETANRLAVVSVRQYRDGSYRYLVGAVTSRRTIAPVSTARNNLLGPASEPISRASSPLPPLQFATWSPSRPGTQTLRSRARRRRC